jgi:hypothetical protein
MNLTGKSTRKVAKANGTHLSLNGIGQAEEPPAADDEGALRETFLDESNVRQVKVDGQILVTVATMLDHRGVRKAELSRRYGLRWNVELDLRNIKTTLGMDVPGCQIPPMHEKWSWFICWPAT